MSPEEYKRFKQSQMGVPRRDRSTTTQKRRHRDQMVYLSDLSNITDGVWFGDGDNGHHPFTDVLSSTSFVGSQLVFDKLKEGGYGNILAFKMKSQWQWGDEEPEFPFMTHIAMELCDHMLSGWTSFWFRYHNTVIVCFAAEKDIDAVFLAMACPDDLMEKRISPEDIVSTLAPNW